MAEKSRKTAKRGRPFPKGKSGNPGGRPKKPPELKSLADKSLAEIENILETTENEKIKLEICKWLYEMQYGKPTQRQELEGKIDTAPTVIAFAGELDEWSK